MIQLLEQKCVADVLRLHTRRTQDTTEILNIQNKAAVVMMAGSYQYTALETKSHIRVLSFMHPLRLENREDWGVEYNKMDLFRLEDVEFEIFQVDLD
jgi:hypothetical protein